MTYRNTSTSELKTWTETRSPASPAAAINRKRQRVDIVHDHGTHAGSSVTVCQRRLCVVIVDIRTVKTRCGYWMISLNSSSRRNHLLSYSIDNTDRMAVKHILDTSCVHVSTVMRGSAKVAHPAWVSIVAAKRSTSRDPLWSCAGRRR